MASGHLLWVGTADGAARFETAVAGTPMADAGLAVETTTEAAQERLRAERSFDCVIAVHDPPTRDCHDVLAATDVPVVVVADEGSSHLASDVLGAGATDYVDLAAVEGDYEKVLDRVAAIRDRERDLETYRTIVETVPEGVFVLDETATIVDGNERGASLLGFDRETLVGTAVRDLVERDIFDESLVEEYTEAVADMLSSSSDRETAILEFDARPADTTETRAFEIVFALQPHDEEYRGTIGVLRDVTERKRRRQELEQYETMAEAIPETVFSIDEMGEFATANRTALDRYGYTQADLEAGVHFEAVVADEDVDRLRAAQRRLLSDEASEATVTVNHTAVTKDGRRFPAESHFGLLWTDDGLTAAGITIDVSERRRRKRRLQVLGRVLRHNLRNDVNVVLGAADRIQAVTTDATVETEVERARAAASELTTVSEEVRELERALERTRSDRGRIDLTRLVAEVVTSAGTDGPAHIETDLPDEAVVQAGETLRTALEHVLENAIEHHDGDTPRIEITLTPADDRDSDWVTLRVGDDGPGIPADERAVIVGDEQITPLQHGSGLGLWTVRWIVEAYGGAVTIEDNDPRGSVVAISLQQP